MFRHRREHRVGHREHTGGPVDAEPLTIPFASTVVPDERYRAPRSWVEQDYPDELMHLDEVDRGGHAAALRTACRSLRT